MEIGNLFLQKISCREKRTTTSAIAALALTSNVPVSRGIEQKSKWLYETRTMKLILPNGWLCHAIMINED